MKFGSLPESNEQLNEAPSEEESAFWLGQVPV